MHWKSNVRSERWYGGNDGNIRIKSRRNRNKRKGRKGKRKERGKKEQKKIKKKRANHGHYILATYWKNTETNGRNGRNAYIKCKSLLFKIPDSPLGGTFVSSLKIIPC